MKIKPVTREEFIRLEAEVHAAMIAAFGEGHEDRWADIDLYPVSKVTGLYGFPVPDGDRASVYPINDYIEVERTDPEWFDQADIIMDDVVIEFEDEIISIA